MEGVYSEPLYTISIIHIRKGSQPAGPALHSNLPYSVQPRKLSVPTCRYSKTLRKEGGEFPISSSLPLYAMGMVHT